jgi:uncharacterized protein YecE (DUF72 family)
MGEVLLGCSGWNYPDTADKGGWTGVFYPDKDTKRLRYYSQFFNTAEMDSSFYDRFYSQMTKGTFIGMSRATPEKFQFSIKVPETITRSIAINSLCDMTFVVAGGLKMKTCNITSGT